MFLIIIIFGGDIILKSNKARIESAKKHLNKIRELVAQIPFPFEGMTEEVIEKLREIRKQLWEKKLATRT